MRLNLFHVYDTYTYIGNLIDVLLNFILCMHARYCGLRVRMRVQINMITRLKSFEETTAPPVQKRSCKQRV